ncbi:uncharacterized protein LOC123294964 [Chrysoperla carnea]|uniref:uncharacterized protein LOC123294964 n=1 Tax=Chrysoperla carnea TaxID=189513 RepID=UPI001D09282F|nr:uncharacterized protein LOC123294964 [Chrysoperla carnea]
MYRLVVSVLCLCLFTSVLSQKNDAENFEVETIDDADIEAVTRPNSGNPSRGSSFTGEQCSICNETSATTCFVKEKSSDNQILSVVKCYDANEKVLKENESSRKNPYPGVQFSRTHIQSNISY